MNARWRLSLTLKLRKKRSTLKLRNWHSQQLGPHSSQVVANSQDENKKIVEECDSELHNSQQEISTLQKSMRLKEQELKHIKRSAYLIKCVATYHLLLPFHQYLDMFDFNISSGWVRGY